MAVSSSRSPGRGIWPLLGYAALGGIALAKQNYRPSDRSPLADRGQPETGAMGTTRSTDEPRQVPRVAGTRLHRGKSPGLAGKTSFGGPTSRSVSIDCSPSRLGSCSTDCWRSSRPLPPWSRYTGSLLRLLRSTSISHLSQVFCPMGRSRSFRSR
jgi:hypothetical protein